MIIGDGISGNCMEYANIDVPRLLRECKYVSLLESNHYQHAQSGEGEILAGTEGAKL